MESSDPSNMANEDNLYHPIVANNTLTQPGSPAADDTVSYSFETLQIAFGTFSSSF